MMFKSCLGVRVLLRGQKLEECALRSGLVASAFVGRSELELQVDLVRLGVQGIDFQPAVVGEGAL